MSLPVLHLLPFLAYAVTMCVTPGPNNAILAMLGARHGWRASLPAAAGIMSGLFGLLVLAGSGVGAAAAAVPGLTRVLGAAGVAYMLYLAVLLWHADGRLGEGDRPALGFWGAVAFQLVNPKALLMALTAAGSFLLPGAGLMGAAAMGALFVAVGTPCVLAWAFMGARLLRTPAHTRLFTRSMALVAGLTAIGMAW